jgi:tripartite-type tricarboxylate transporter receptor subunit TctC
MTSRLRFAHTASAFLTVAVSVFFSTGSTAAEDMFYKDKTIRMISASAAGGGYDAIARLVAKHMPKHIPGNPHIIVVNMPGASGNLAANHVYNIAPKDGTAIGAFNRTSITAPLMGRDEIKFDLDQFQWLGTYASYRDNSFVLWIRRENPQRTIKDLQDPNMKTLNLGISGEEVTAVLKEALHLNVKLIRGYSGSAGLDLAFERGEVDGQTSGYDSVKANKSHWISEMARPIVQFGRGMVPLDIPDLKGIPTALQVAVSPDDKALIELGEIALIVARPFALPPGVPPERVEMLRRAFDKTMVDPELIKENGSQFEISPKSGEEVQKIIATLRTIPPAVVERYKKATAE